jgi:hypothetical protein
VEEGDAFARHLFLNAAAAAAASGVTCSPSWDLLGTPLKAWLAFSMATSVVTSSQ